MGKRENNLAFLKAIHHQFGLPISHELVVDNFAGGGGASFGIEMAIGRNVDLAINHDPEAVALHEANHPYTKHYCESVWDVDPREATGGRPVGLAWFSPDCKHFSKAKGGKPVEKKIRGLAWVVIRWAAKVKPRVIILENVEEFQTWGPLTNDNMPCPKRKGQTFRKWVDALRALGYQVEWRELRACDFGAPTIRKRLFLIARCDGKPIVWPAPTHGNGKGLRPYLTAADCIDWSIPCPSIFERSRPLAENTLKRIARGIQRYVIEAKKPFIVTCNHAGNGFRGQGTDEPFKTLTAARDAHGLVVPQVVSAAHSKTTGRGPNVWPADEPLRTVTSSNDKYLVAPHLVGIDHKSSGASCAWDIEQPITTVTAEARHAVVASTLIQTGYGEREGQAPRVPGIDKPLGTVVAGGQKHALVSAFLKAHIHNEGSNDEFKVGCNSSDIAIGECGDTEDNPGWTGVEIEKDASCRPIGTDNPTADGMSPKTRVSGRPGSCRLEAISCSSASSNLDEIHGGHTAQHGYQPQGRRQDKQQSLESGSGNPQREYKARIPYWVASGVSEHSPANTGQGYTGGQASPRNGDVLLPDSKTDGHLSNNGFPGHSREVAALLIKYYGTGGQWQEMTDPMHTIPTKDRMGLVMVDGEQYQIADIGMRMLVPRELYRAQGFPDSYKIEITYKGKPLSKTAQVRMCGNSVSPVMARALVGANYLDQAEAIPARELETA